MATRDIVQHRNLSEHVEMAFAHSIRFYQVLSDSIGICPVLWFLRFVLSRSKWMPSSINLCLDGKNLYFSALYIYVCPAYHAFFPFAAGRTGKKSESV